MAPSMAQIDQVKFGELCYPSLPVIPVTLILLSFGSVKAIL